MLRMLEGRYGTTKFTVAGQSALIELAVSGPFVNNETLIIQPMNGQVTWDGATILKHIPSEFVKPFSRIKFIDGDEHIDEVLKGYPVKLIRAFFVRNVEILVNRWPEHIDAIIRMPQQLYGQEQLQPLECNCESTPAERAAGKVIGGYDMVRSHRVGPGQCNLGQGNAAVEYIHMLETGPG